jgi:hypothetical protein
MESLKQGTKLTLTIKEKQINWTTLKLITSVHQKLPLRE